MNTKRECLYCGKCINEMRSDAKFCSRIHKVNYKVYRKRNKLYLIENKIENSKRETI